MPRTVEELEAEILVLNRLVDMAQEVRDAGVDEKWEALADLLRSEAMYDATSGVRRKIIIFTEHRDTLDYLEDRLSLLLGRDNRIEVIHGGVDRGQRRLAQVRFTQDAQSTVLLATDAAGEGVNLQVAHLMINYDIPWNPNRLEQRFGRIHRIGQTEVCHLWNLVALDTREGDVFHTLLEKVEVQRQALGDQVFDVLGEVLTDSELRDLLTRALHGASHGEVTRAVEARIGSDLQDAVTRRTRSISRLTEEDLRQLRHDMTLSSAHQFQPDVVRDFTAEAMNRLRGDLQPQGDHWVVRHVPERVRSWPGQPELLEKPRYDALTFSRDPGTRPIANRPELISPGHPLTSALVGVVTDDHGAHLTQGTVLEDDRSAVSYVLATFAVGNGGTGSDGAAARLVTYQVSQDGDCQLADPAAYTSLNASPKSLDENMQASARRAVSSAQDVAGATAELVAIAYVAGTAEDETHDAWQRARSMAEEALVAYGTVERALPFEGWDLRLETSGSLHFITAIPDTAELPTALRRSERIAAGNVGRQYRLAVCGAGRVTWLMPESQSAEWRETSSPLQTPTL
jgi:hypothetical protein